MHRPDTRRWWRGPLATIAALVAVALAGCGDDPLTPTDPAASDEEPGLLVSTSGAVAISPGQSIQGFVDRHPAGTKFLLKAGTHSRQTIRPKDGQQFLGEWPNTILDGGNSAQYAFETLRSAPKNVVIQQLIIQNYATPDIGQGAIQGDNGIGWTIEQNEVRNNRAVGIRVGDGFKVLRNKIHHNGISGVAGYKADNVLVEGNEVSYNNTSNTVLSPSMSTIAGIKVLMGHNFTARNNHVHHNRGKGIWMDHMLLNTLVENNRVTDNYGPGIWHEISYGAIIRNNVVRYNGLGGSSWLDGAGIQVSNSPDVQIYGNRVEYNANGITAMYATGYPSSGPYGPKVLKNLHVHDNVVGMMKGKSGIATNTGNNSVFSSWNNRYVHNTYYTGSLSAPFAWRGASYTVSQWRAVPQDATGSFHTGAPPAGNDPPTSPPPPPPPPPPPDTSVSTPTGVIAISPGQSIQGFVDRYPTGTKFLLRAGTHSRQTIRPKDGQQFLGEAGTVLDGGNSAQYAFETLTRAPRNVLIKGLIIQNYATSTGSQAAIQGDNGIGWTVEATEVRNNRTVGIRAGDGWKLLRNKVHHNGTTGVSGYKADNVVLDGNEVSYNNTSGTTQSPAGVRFHSAQNFTARNNNVHHNRGQGIWTDHMLLNTVIENNQVTDNTGAGVWHAASYNAVIRNNRVRNNGLGGASWLGGAGIQVSNSPNVEVYGNTVEYNANGITAMQASGYPTSGAHGALVVQNLHVHDNVVRMSRGRTGVAVNTGDNSIFSTRNNRYVHNTYYTGTLSTPFMWRNAGYSVSQWRAVPQDATGSFNR